MSITLGTFESGMMDVHCSSSGEFLGFIEDTEYTGNKHPGGDRFVFVQTAPCDETDLEEGFVYTNSLGVAQMFAILNNIMEMNLEAAAA